MFLKNHIANRLLIDPYFWEEVATTQARNDNYQVEQDGTFVDAEKGSHREEKYYSMLDLLIDDGNKTYVITQSVLDMLQYFDTKKSMEITGWKAFEHLPDFKKTLILPDNVAIRVQKKHGVLYFCHFKMTPDKTKDNYGHLYWILLFVHFDRNHMAEHFQSADGKRIAPFLFALLCFLLLTDKNEEILLGPGQKYGTIKTGKTINIFPTPITIVNSKWNTIIRRTDGFPVSGHFRLQPYNHGSYYQLIFIEPFMKTGYTRRSGKELEDEKNL